MPRKTQPPSHSVAVAVAILDVIVVLAMLIALFH